MSLARTMSYCLRRSPSLAARYPVFADHFQWVCTWNEFASLSISTTYEVGRAREALLLSCLVRSNNMPPVGYTP